MIGVVGLSQGAAFLENFRKEVCPGIAEKAAKRQPGSSAHVKQM